MSEGVVAYIRVVLAPQAVIALGREGETGHVFDPAQHQGLVHTLHGERPRGCRIQGLTHTKGFIYAVVRRERGIRGWASYTTPHLTVDVHVHMHGGHGLEWQPHLHACMMTHQLALRWKPHLHLLAQPTYVCCK